MTHVSVIGCGNMGGALLEGLAASGNYELTACDLDPDARAAAEPYATQTTADLDDAVEAELVVIAVKPNVIDTVLADLDLGSEQTLVSIAAGVSTDRLATHTDATVVRVMPNLAARTQNMAAAVTGETIPEAVKQLLDTVGEFIEVEEAQMDIATAVNGSGPAFVFYLLGAMADAGVDRGLSEDEARTLAAQTFKGAAETVFRSEESIEDLIDAVCSPGGTTIEGMEVLWDSTAAESVTDAVLAAERRSKELAADGDDD